MQEIFSRSRFRYIAPPVASMGHLALSSVQQVLFTLCALISRQSLLQTDGASDQSSMLFDQMTALNQTRLVMERCRALSYELEFQGNEKVVRFARQLLEESLRILKRVKTDGLLQSFIEGAWMHLKVKSSKTEHAALIKKDAAYLSPFTDARPVERQAQRRSFAQDRRPQNSDQRRERSPPRGTDPRKPRQDYRSRDQRPQDQIEQHDLPHENDKPEFYAQEVYQKSAEQLEHIAENYSEENLAQQEPVAESLVSAEQNNQTQRKPRGDFKKYDRRRPPRQRANQNEESPETTGSEAGVTESSAPELPLVDNATQVLKRRELKPKSSEDSAAPESSHSTDKSEEA